MIGRLFLLTLVASCYSQEVQKRQGKLFLVSTTTATSMTTTTSSLTTSSVCFFPVTNTALKACTATGRKKRAVVRDPLSDDEFDSVLPSAASDSKDLESGVEAEASSHRQARFFLYYMTTTSTSYTGTYSVTLISCTPTTFVTLCGR